MSEGKTDPELMSYVVCLLQEEEMLEITILKISISFMSLNLDNWLLESQ